MLQPALDLIDSILNISGNSIGQKDLAHTKASLNGNHEATQTMLDDAKGAISSAIKNHQDVIRHTFNHATEPASNTRTQSSHTIF